MGVEYEIFAATEDELRAHFVGWKEPLKTPVEKAGINPFTKQPTLFRSWDPDPDHEPRRVHDVPARCCEIAIDETSLQALMETIEGKPCDDFLDRPALIGPNEGQVLVRIPASFVDRLTSLDAAALEAATARWVDAQRRDLEGIADASTRRSMLERWTAAGERRALSVLLEFFLTHRDAGFFMRITW